MKWLLAALLVNFAYADSKPRIDVDENHPGPAEEQEADTNIKQEEQEASVNDDFDPELDAIDDDITVDEGLNDLNDD